MGVKICNNCKKPMRFESTHCNSCRSEYKQSIPKWMIISIILAVLILSFVIATPRTSSPSPEKAAKTKLIQQQTQSRLALQGYLKDPTSAEIRNHKGNCGQVNGKNSLGAYTGFKRFIATPAIVVIEGENMEPVEFQKNWGVFCQ